MKTFADYLTEEKTSQTKTDKQKKVLDICKKYNITNPRIKFKDDDYNIIIKKHNITVTFENDSLFSDTDFDVNMSTLSITDANTFNAYIKDIELFNKAVQEIKKVI